MKRTLGRLAGAVVAGALITLVVSPAALAQEGTDPTPTTTTSETPTSDAPKPSDTPTSEAPKPESPQGKVTTDPATPTEPTKTSEPSTMPTKPAPITTDYLPVADDYVDDWAYGIDFPEEVYGADGALVIACAAGQPANVFSSDIDLNPTIFNNPTQDEGDPRYWDYYVKRHPGASFDHQTIIVGWDCGDRHIQKPIPPAGGGAGAGAAAGPSGSQVKVTPKGGIETGGGATARS